MTASSQNPPGAQALEPPYPVAAVVAQAAPAPLSPVRVTTGVIRAAMDNGHITPEEIAQAEQDAGVIFDPQRAQEIWDAAYTQAKTEDRAELAQAAQDRTTLAWLRERWRAVGQLCQGRLHTDLLTVSEVLTAVDGNAPTGAPLAVTWNAPIVMGPSGDTPKENTLVPCTTARGGPAALVLDDEARLQLGGLLLASLHTAEACATRGCGAPEDQLDASDPHAHGWILLDVAGTEGGPRWWCNPLCANAALAAARAELAADDRAAAVDPDAQAPEPDLHTPDAEAEAVRRSVDRAFPVVAAFLADQQPGHDGGRRFFADDDPPGEDDTEPQHLVDDDEPHCVRCGCTANRPCAGGCHWVPNAGLVDLCSRCAHPEDITPETNTMGGAW